MDISIVIPVYNGEETLKTCLDAVTALRIPEGMSIEILLINDGSTDRTREIAEGYPEVRVIDLEKNSGRIVARKTGAENAEYDDLLFVDARVEVFPDVLEKIAEINYQPLMAGSLNEEKYRSDYDTLLYLIRKKIYQPYYPQNLYGEFLWIDESNFFKAPKGTTCIFINRELFLTSIPEEKSKDTSDDTKILRCIVYRKKIKILRHTGISIKYKQRIGSNIFSWIQHRGRIWADHYLSFFNGYSITYAIITLFAFLILFSSPANFIFFIILFFVSVSIYLSENARDFLIVLKILPFLSICFYAGSLEKIFKKIFRI